MNHAITHKFSSSTRYPIFIVIQWNTDGKNYVFMPEICIMICCLIIKLEKVMTILVIFIEYPQRKTQDI